MLHKTLLLLINLTIFEFFIRSTLAIYVFTCSSTPSTSPLETQWCFSPTASAKANGCTNDRYIYCVEASTFLITWPFRNLLTFKPLGMCSNPSLSYGLTDAEISQLQKGDYNNQTVMLSQMDYCYAPKYECSQHNGVPSYSHSTCNKLNTDLICAQIAPNPIFSIRCVRRRVDSSSLEEVLQLNVCSEESEPTLPIIAQKNMPPVYPYLEWHSPETCKTPILDHFLAFTCQSDLLRGKVVIGEKTECFNNPVCGVARSIGCHGEGTTITGGVVILEDGSTIISMPQEPAKYSLAAPLSSCEVRREDDVRRILTTQTMWRDVQELSHAIFELPSLSEYVFPNYDRNGIDCNDKRDWSGANIIYVEKMSVLFVFIIMIMT